MKRTAGLLLAVIMLFTCAAAYAVPEGAEVRKSVTYTGQTVNAGSVSVGSTFTFTVSVSASSGLFSGLWLIDHPENIVTPVSVSTTWSGSLYSQLAGNNTTDTANFVYNTVYAGQTGEVPVGEAGNLYTSVGMYLTSFDHWGVQLGGEFVRVTYRLDRIPNASELSHDSNGYYFEIPIVVIESDYFVQGSVIAPGNEYARPHENVNVVNGRVYLNVGQQTHTVRFYGFNNVLLSTQQVPHGGSATAPNAPDVLNTAGLYRFYRWDRGFTNVTQDIDVHADYVLMGDVNSSGAVDSTDALLTLRNTLGMYSLTPRQGFTADVNSSGNVDSTDALLILRVTIGIIAHF